MRILFLDDDPIRAAAFTLTRPEAVWVTTVEDCLTRLVEVWDEVHLDHDLGGEAFVDHERDDCGMAIVRWLCHEPRGHLVATRFFIHSHNENASCIMALHLEVMGYRVEARPFGRQPTDRLPRPVEAPRRRVPWSRRLIDWLRGRSIPRRIL